jgi:hypothetical protein
MILSTLAFLLCSPKNETAAWQDDETAKSYLESKYRWAVKTGSDEAARQIDTTDEGLAKAETFTVSQMTEWVRPKLNSTNVQNRQAPYETKLVTVTATLTDYRLSKDDQDLHLVLKEPDQPEGLTIIGEIPDPSLVVKENPWRAFYIPNRAAFYELFKPRSAWKTANRRVRIIGVPFFDLAHGQRGVAKNGIEIHPILKLEVLD